MATLDEAPGGAGGDPGFGIGNSEAGGRHGTSGALLEPNPAPTPSPEPAPKPSATPAPRSAADPEPTPTGGTPPVEPPPPPKSWPDQWRELIAGDDKKKIDRLSRFKDPSQVLNSYMALEHDLSSGRYKRTLPTHYTAEELADYRKSNGIPESADGYDTSIGDGVVWGDADQTHIKDFTEWAHEHNAPPDMVKMGLGWWHQYQEKLVAAQDEIDAANAQAAIADMKASWGGKDAANKNFIRNVLEQEKGLYADVMQARGPDGRRLGDNPKFLKFLLERFSMADPYPMDLPGGGQDPSKTVDAEMAEIKALMGDKGSKYWRGAESAGLQARYRDLLGIKERIAQHAR